MSLLTTLNPKQQDAVATTEGPLLIIAGAGSGKTRVITHRIAYLVEENHIAPENILAITFTNKAAKEMRERVEKLLGSASTGMWVNTFHAACARILRRDAEHLGYARSFLVYDSSDSQSLIKEIIKNYNIDDKRFPPKSVQAQISEAKNKMQNVEEYISANPGNFFAETVARVYRAYQKRLREANAFDFDDLLMQTVKLFVDFPLILKYYQNNFRYIHVDEYQDTNFAQYSLVKLLAEGSRNLCVVGDPDQSIYAWRGADLRNILDFEKDYPDAKIIRLEQNYRSTKTILTAANEVIKNNMDRKAKNLWTENAEGAPITYYRAESDHQESRFVVSEIFHSCSAQGKKYNDFAILYRTNAQSRIFEEYFMQYSIPYKIIGGTKFFERKEIKDILAYLRIFYNSADGISIKRIINVPKRGAGASTWDKLVEYSLANACSLYDSIAAIENISGISGKALSGIKSLYHLFEDIKKQNVESLTSLTKYLMKESGYIGELEREKTPEAEERIENLKEFLSITQEFEENNDEPTLENFLTGMTLMGDADTIDEGNFVTMMTMHTAKGLEYPIVFIVGMEENLFPHIRAVLSEDELEEERRLCYVGMTRAMEKLYLTNAQTRMFFGKHSANSTSRFIKEVPDELLQKEGLGKLIQAKPSEKNDVHFNSKDNKPTHTVTVGALAPGNKVNHAKFGLGTVVSIKGAGEETEVSVAFEGLGIKALILKYAPLSKV